MTFEEWFVRNVTSLPDDEAPLWRECWDAAVATEQARHKSTYVRLLDKEAEIERLNERILGLVADLKDAATYD